MPRQTLYDHPKFVRLCHDLDMPEPHVLGHLEYMWRVGYASGDDRLGDATDVELAAKWKGEKGKLCAALAAVRFLDKKRKAYHIHDLLENAPEYVTGRRRAEQERKNKKTCEVCGETFFSNRRDKKTCSDGCRTSKCRLGKNKCVDVTDTVTDRNVTETFRHTTPPHAHALTHTLPHAPSPTTVGAGAASEETRMALKEFGIMEPMQGKLIADIPCLTAEVVRAIKSTMSPKAGTGAFINAIKANSAEVHRDLEAKQRRSRQEHERAAASRDAEKAADAQRKLQESEAAAKQEAIANFKKAIPQKKWQELEERFLCAHNTAIYQNHADFRAEGIFNAIQSGELTFPDSQPEQEAR